MRQIGIALFALTLAASTSFAHYNMLLPDKPWANKDEKVTFTYQFGHPYEHELFDAPKPVALVLTTPKGKNETFDIEEKLTPIKKDGTDAKKVTAWQFTFTPPERGDYTFMLKTAAIKHDGSMIQDVVKVVLHVQTQNGWDAGNTWHHGGAFDIRPYTRPYGLLPGMCFRGCVENAGAPLGKRELEEYLSGLPIEIEKYNEQAPKKLPPDELITFTTTTDSKGFFVTTLPEAGWWGITVSPRHTEKRNEETSIRRVTHWLHVDEKK